MLNELLEDYQEFNEDEALDEFIKLLWNSKYGCRTFKKSYSFKIQSELLSNNEELIDLFRPFQKIEVKHAISYYKDNPNSVDMIRIHINNMYMFLADKDVYLSKEYFNSKIYPKKLYFKVIEDIKNGVEINIKEIEQKLLDSEKKTEEIRQRDIGKKINLSFSEYKKVINGYLHRLFNNYKPPHEYEDEHGWELNVTHDAWHEDNYIVKYFCKSLTGYMKNYVKQTRYHKCKECGDKIRSTNKKMLCKKCVQVKLYEKKCVICKETFSTNYKQQITCLVCKNEKEKIRKRDIWHKYKHKYKTS